MKAPFYKTHLFWGKQSQTPTVPKTDKDETPQMIGDGL